MILCCYDTTTTHMASAGPTPSRNKSSKQTLVNSLNSWQACGSVCKDLPPEYPKHSTTFPNISDQTNTHTRPNSRRFTAQQAARTRPRADSRLEPWEEGQGGREVAGREPEPWIRSPDRGVQQVAETDHHRRCWWRQQQGWLRSAGSYYSERK